MIVSFLRRALLCALSCAFPTTGAALAADMVKLTTAQQTSAGIETALPARGRPTNLPGLPGQVVIPNSQLRVVSAPLAGLVEVIQVATQQTVRKGQVVARLQSPGLADVQHTYLQAASQLQLARAALDRDEKLFAEDIIARSRLEATRSRQQEMAADLAERTMALRAAGMSDEAMSRLRAGRGVGLVIELAAPIDGVVLEQMVAVGQRVEAAVPIMRIARLDPLWIETQAPADRISSIVPGAAAFVPAAGARGKVISIGRAISSGTQTVPVRIEVRDGASRLRPGQLVEVVLSGQAESASWAIPASAIARLGNRTVIYVQVADGFASVPVKVLEERADGVQISAPLKGAERIAVKGIAVLKAMQSGIGGGQ